MAGGLEIALACHARFVLDDKKIKLGQPEVKLGLLPGGGGTVRLPRLVGMQQALQILAEGNDIAPQQALGMGLVTTLAPDRDALLKQSKEWITANPKAKQPWDQPKFKMPGGDSRAPAVVQMLAVAPSLASANSWGNYPAVQHIMSSVFEGGLVDFDSACTIESRYFAACAMSQVSRNMIGTLWYQLNAIKKSASRPAGVPAAKVTKLGVLGAGMMGGGIAYVSSKVGIRFIPGDTFRELLNTSPFFARNMLTTLAREFTVWMNRMTIFTQFSVRHRLILALLILHEQYRHSGTPGGVVTITRSELAEYVGASLETVVRTLNTLKSINLVHINGRRILLPNVAGLMDILEGEGV